MVKKRRDDVPDEEYLEMNSLNSLGRRLASSVFLIEHWGIILEADSCVELCSRLPQK